MKSSITAESSNAEINAVVESLKNGLRTNLYSCVLYGSAVRGNFVPGVSDINLLIVLEESTPEAHTVIAEIIRDHGRIAPLIMGRQGFERSLQVFALKFRSIQRNYRVLHGADPLSDFTPDAALVRFLCEQSLRNLRLRLKHAFVVFGHDRQRYTLYVTRSIPALFVALSEALRCAGISIPGDYSARISVFEKELGSEALYLHELLALRNRVRDLSADEIVDSHSHLFRLLCRALDWMEAKWPNLSLAKEK